MREFELIRNKTNKKSEKIIDTIICDTHSEALLHFSNYLMQVDNMTKQSLYSLYQTAWIDEDTGEYIPVTKPRNPKSLLLKQLEQFNKTNRLNQYGQEMYSKLLNEYLNQDLTTKIFINFSKEDETDRYIHSSPDYNPNDYQVKEDYLITLPMLDYGKIEKNHTNVNTSYDQQSEGELTQLINNIIGWVHLYKGEHSDYTQKLITEDYPIPKYDLNLTNPYYPFKDSYEDFINRLRTDKKYNKQFLPSKTKKQQNNLSLEENYLDNQSILQVFTPIPEKDFLNNTGKWLPKLDYKYKKVYSEYHGHDIYIRLNTKEF